MLVSGEKDKLNEYVTMLVLKLISFLMQSKKFGTLDYIMHEYAKFICITPIPF